MKQQFYAVLAARESQAAAQSQLDEAQQGMRVSVAKVQAATATKSDSLRSLIQVGNARLALLTAQNDLRSANAALTRLVATPFTVTASPEDTVEEEKLAVDSAQLLRDAEAGPPVQQAAGQQLLARAQARIARAPYLPTISLGYGLAGNTFDQSFQLFSTDTRYTNQFRLSLSYPLFNQLQREQGVVQADVQRDVADANLRDARLAAQQSLVQYLGALHTAEEQVSIARTSVEAAEEDLRVQQQRYGLGVSILLDVLTSQAAADDGASSAHPGALQLSAWPRRSSRRSWGASCEPPGASRTEAAGRRRPCARRLLTRQEQRCPARADRARAAAGHRRRCAGHRRHRADQCGAGQVEGLGAGDPHVGDDRVAT